MPKRPAPRTKTLIAAMVEPTLKAELKRIAAAKRRSLSQHVRIVLEDHVSQELELAS